METKTLRGEEMQSEPLDRPVKVIHPDAKTVREEPCVYRKSGLAIWRADNKRGPCEEWPSNDVFCVTHEDSGAQVCAFPTRFEAIGALLCALTLTDWKQDMQTVARAINADQTKLGAIHALRAGRLEMVPLDGLPHPKARA